MSIRSGDRIVLVKDITEREGRSKPRGHVARVLSVDPQKKRVIVEGVNFRYRHMRKSQKHPQGGRLEKEGPIHISNVMLYCDHCKKGVRVARRKSPEGDVSRACKKCGQVVGSDKK
jgi:large subunit ribosomal protein L24